MKRFDQKATYRYLSGSAVVLFLFCALINSRATAANKPVKPQPISVVAHIAVPGTPANQMLLEYQGHREYLFLLRSSGKGFTVLDVTKPESPTVLKKVTLPETSTQNLALVGNSMAIAEQFQKNNSTRLDQPESIQLLDLADPANPRPMQTFAGVTSFLTEDGRHLVYISNADGLWILRRPTKSTTHPCTSSDAISAYPECQ